PHGTARRLIGTLAHPLNRPRLSPDGQHVFGGYTIIQPRVSSSLPSATATRYSRVFADAIGLDPYSHAVSDLYQDLAGEGSYYGKGIYDVATFHRLLSGRFPPATLLSHDLLEGAHVRVGMATDIELLDAFPSSYLADSQRQQRWVRGDWQIAAWCGRSVPTAAARREPNPLGLLNRWKILDNLRRSLFPATSVVLLLVSWLLYPSLALLASLLTGLSMFLPLVLRLLTWAPFQPRAVLSSGRAWREQGIVWVRTLVSVGLLPHQAALTLGAIGRTLYRKLVSHRNLLQWQTYRAANRRARSGNRRVARQMLFISLASVVVAMLLLLTHPTAAPAAAPFLLLWLLSPVTVSWLGVAWKAQPAHVLASADRLGMRWMARETWRYFDDLVGPASNWLPPDNYQEAPRPELAERTSPTNIGLWLLATLAAHDFGYLTPDQVIERGEATLDTLERVERFEGHLLNWYNT
ncbi:MAG: glycosyl transferase, partial [Chloroflexota bacterium]